MRNLIEHSKMPMMPEADKEGSHGLRSYGGVRTHNRDTRQRPTNLKRSRSERVSWGEAVKSTVTVPLLERRHKDQVS